MKRYVQEVGTAAVRRLIARAAIATSRLSDVEVASAIVRRTREGSIDARQRDRILGRWRRDLPALQVVEVTPVVTALARDLLLRHSLRASDAIQLASAAMLARELQIPLEFVCFDDRLNTAADAEGLTPVS